VGVALVATLVLGACGDDTAAPPPDDLRAPAALETCDAFGAGRALTEVGITYDYEPSDSLDDLADSSQVVLGGRVAWVSGLETDSSDLVILHIEVDEIARDHSGGISVGEITRVGVSYNPAEVELGTIRDAIPLGIQVVAFLGRTTDFGFRFPHLEGLYLACGDGAVPAGAKTSWKVPNTLEAILEAVTAG